MINTSVYLFNSQLEYLLKDVPLGGRLLGWSWVDGALESSDGLLAAALVDVGLAVAAPEGAAGPGAAAAAVALGRVGPQGAEWRVDFGVDLILGLPGGASISVCWGAPMQWGSAVVAPAHPGNFFCAQGDATVLVEVQQRQLIQGSCNTMQPIMRLQVCCCASFCAHRIYRRETYSLRTLFTTD
eukprot:306358-Pelagomonas_calceolata.AAC.4